MRSASSVPRFASVLLAVALAACGTGSPEPPALPEATVPGSWVQPAPSAARPLTALAETDPWWTLFGSDELSGLVSTALQNNPDLDASRQRIAQARAQARAAGASLSPTLNGAGSGRRSWPGQGKPGNSFGASLDAAYEVDLWGGTRAEVRSAEATALSSVYESDAAALSLSAEVATTYFQLLALDDQLTSSRRILDIARDLLSLVERQRAAGAVSGLEVSRQRGTVASLRASTASLEQQRAETVNALAALLGTTPGAVSVSAATLTGLEAPAVAPGLPSDLLTRRPDLRSAEAKLAAAHADVAVARAAMLPSLSLTGRAGWSSDALNKLFTPSGFLSNLAAGLTGPIFDGGRLAAQRDRSLAAERAALDSYRTAILLAFQDVENALAGVRYQTEVESAQRDAFTEAQTALDIAEARYRAGRTDFLSLLDVQRSLFEEEQSLVRAHLARLDASVALVKALGGGWSDPGRS